MTMVDLRAATGLGIGEMIKVKARATNALGAAFSWSNPNTDTVQQQDKPVSAVSNLVATIVSTTQVDLQ